MSGGLFDDLDADVAAHDGECDACRDLAPAGYAGHWRDWHRGHGCDLDPERRAPEAWRCREHRATIVTRETAANYLGRLECPICLRSGVVGTLEPFRGETVRDVCGSDTFLDCRPDGTGLDDGPPDSIVRPRKTPARSRQAGAGEANDTEARVAVEGEARRLLAAVRLTLVRVRAHTSPPEWLTDEIVRGIAAVEAFVPAAEWSIDDPINARKGHKSRE